MINTKPYYKLTNEQVDKIGNSIIFLSERIPLLSKTKLLKLLYLLDELSIKNSGIPFFNLQYKVWKLGPVSEDIFIELSDTPALLKKYINIENKEKGTFISPNSKFSDDEFSDNDIELIECVVRDFKNKSAKSLIKYTHRKNSPWRNAAEKEGVYELLENGSINNTEIIIDLSDLVAHDERKKSLYSQYTEER